MGRRVGLMLAALSAVVIVAAMISSAGPYLEAFRAWVETLGLWGPLVFVGGYALLIVAVVPGSLLTLGAGAIFGLGPGTLFVFMGASTGACAAFLIARYWARGAIEQRVANSARFEAIDRAVTREGRKITFLLRLSPLFPFPLLNYALGLTGVRFRDYALACLGLLPGTIMYVYLGSLANIGSTDFAHWLAPVPYLAGLLATAAITFVITRIARRALAEATGGA